MQNVPKRLSLIFYFEIVEYTEDTCFQYILIHFMDQLYLKKKKIRGVYCVSPESFEIYLTILRLYIKTQ